VNVFACFYNKKKKAVRRFQFKHIESSEYRLDVATRKLPSKEISYRIEIERSGRVVERSGMYEVRVEEPWVPF
jgi:hypothetical protein